MQGSSLMAAQLVVSSVVLSSTVCISIFTFLDGRLKKVQTSMVEITI
jgi:hypothetical protein